MKTTYGKALAGSKINLNLEVLGKRPDGYHNISGIMQSISLSNEIEIKLNNTGKVTFASTEQDLKNGSLAQKAAELFFKSTGLNLGADIFLKVNIPFASGLGGGSADAAAVLVLLNHMTENLLSLSKLAELGLSLGADVPFCISGGTQIAEGIGEILTPLPPLKQHKVLIIKNHTKTSTADMFAKIDSCLPSPSHTKQIANLLKNNKIKDAAALCRNDFLNISNDKNHINCILDELYSTGALLAGLSGSGPTVFGIFKNINEDIFKHFKNKYAFTYLAETQNYSIKIV